MSVAPDIESSRDSRDAPVSQRDSGTKRLGQTFTVFIESGFHAGTVQRLAPGSYTLGSELDADIVLSDDDIKSIHLIIDLDPRGLRLEPLQGAVTIQGEPDALEPGSERHLAFPASFKAGEATIRVTAPADSVQTRRRRRILMAAGGCAMLAVIGFQIVDPFAGPAPGSSPDVPMQLAGPEEPRAIDPGAAAEIADAGRADAPSSPEREAEGLVEVEPEVTLDQAAAALRERLAAENLTDIKVQTAIDRIMVRGDAEPARMDAWQDIRIWFDGAYGRDFLLVADIEPAENETPPDLAIEAVWSGDDPYLIAGGQRFFVGAHVGDGWMIDRIGADEIRFKRGEKSFSLTL